MEPWEYEITHVELDSPESLKGYYNAHWEPMSVTTDKDGNPVLWLKRLHGNKWMMSLSHQLKQEGNKEAVLNRS